MTAQQKNPLARIFLLVPRRGLGHSRRSRFVLHTRFDLAPSTPTRRLTPRSSGRLRAASVQVLPVQQTKSPRFSAGLICLWCPGEDLNLHALRHIHLKDACIPISPPGHFNQLGDYTPKECRIQEKAVSRLSASLLFSPQQELLHFLQQKLLPEQLLLRRSLLRPPQQLLRQPPQLLQKPLRGRVRACCASCG